MNTNVKQIFIAAIMLGASLGGNAGGETSVSDIDAQISDCRAKIRSLRDNNEKSIRRALLSDPDYRYVTEHHDDVERMRRDNDEILAMACDFVRDKDPLAVTSHTTMVFMLYSRHYPRVASLQRLYESNERMIERYDERKSNLQPRILRAKNRQDSIMHVGIDRLQLQIDSLLNVKINLVRQRHF